jgi:hypothetical protein
MPHQSTVVAVNSYLGPRDGLNKIKEAMTKPVKDSKLCDFEDCPNKAIFRIIGGKNSRCTEHVLPEMIDAKHPRCGLDGCLKQRNFALPGQKALRCAKCKDPDMIDVIHTHCEKPGCPFIASYGTDGGKPTHCATHKALDALDVTHPKCIKPGGCPHQRTFGLEGGMALYCAVHKKDGMLNVVSRKCNEEGCPRIPYFGLEKGTATHCDEHKPPGAKNVVSRRCAEEGCPSVNPHFGPPGSKTSTHCSVHKLPGHVSHQANPCSSCGLPYFIKKGALCRNCDPEVQRNKNLREEKVKTFLGARFPGLEYRHDKGLPDRFCKEVKSRPDFLFDCDTHLVELEVDQFEHRNYEEGCELARQYNIVAATGLPVHFIRYNPDSFSIDGKKVQVGEKRRHALLERELKSALAQAPEGGEMVRIVHLFYTREGPFKTPEDGFVVEDTAIIAERFSELMREGVIRTVDF